MKRWLFIFAVVVSVIFFGRLYAEFDPSQNLQNRLWKTSTTASYDTGIRIASGAVIVYGVEKDSAGFNSILELFNGNLSSNTATRMTNPIDTSQLAGQNFVPVYYSSGLIYNNITITTTTASKPGSIRIFWDWLVVPGQTP